MSKIRDFKLEGLVPAVFTPMTTDGAIDYDKIDAYSRYLSDLGVKQVFLNGTTGEGFSLTLDERKKIVETWVRVGKESGRIRDIVVHVGSLNMHDSQELAKHAAVAGVDAIATVPPLFFKPSKLEYIVEYCKKIAEAAPNVPFYYYHIPTMTGVEVNIEDFLVMASKEIPSLVGAKFSSKDLVDFLGCTQLTAPNRSDSKYNLMFGCDEQLMAAMVMGGHGSVGSTPNLMWGTMARVLQLTAQGNFPEARKEQLRCQKTVRIMLKYGPQLGGNVAALKAILALVGMDTGPPRAPMRAPSAEEARAIKADLNAIGFFNWDK
ncbi:N-acetylneuraminate lyase-like [Dreissena polymorpha]|uniref:N-acetylneuraminate lyase-like n=1 Tax=Dreissena polymorpha TaxID=45954 RepID=UPI002265341F|nr:N-acetylneuraminate lyase-like [Dreissena polymorpha]